MGSRGKNWLGLFYIGVISQRNRPIMSSPELLQLMGTVGLCSMAFVTQTVGNSKFCLGQFSAVA